VNFAEDASVTAGTWKEYALMRAAYEIVSVISILLSEQSRRVQKSR
jgi:hypothetical protein